MAMYVVDMPDEWKPSRHYTHEILFALANAKKITESPITMDRVIQYKGKICKLYAVEVEGDKK